MNKLERRITKLEKIIKINEKFAIQPYITELKIGFDEAWSYICKPGASNPFNKALDDGGFIYSHKIELNQIPAVNVYFFYAFLQDEAEDVFEQLKPEPYLRFNPLAEAATNIEYNCIVMNLNNIIENHFDTLEFGLGDANSFDDVVKILIKIVNTAKVKNEAYKTFLHEASHIVDINTGNIAKNPNRILSDFTLMQMPSSIPEKERNLIAYIIYAILTPTEYNAHMLNGVLTNIDFAEKEALPFLKNKWPLYGEDAIRDIKFYMLRCAANEMNTKFMQKLNSMSTNEFKRWFANNAKKAFINAPVLHMKRNSQLYSYEKDVDKLAEKLVLFLNRTNKKSTFNVYSNKKQTFVSVKLMFESFDLTTITIDNGDKILEINLLSEYTDCALEHKFNDTIVKKQAKILASAMINFVNK